MLIYTNFKRGSEWRRWDLHIHTPETKKNDQFIGATADEKWTNYINAINGSADEISVIGITDYFCIDNYFKFKRLISEGRITKHFDLVIPNVELRITPVTSAAIPINIHCLFNPKIEADIESRFLSKLKFTYGDSSYSARKSELIRLGKALPGKSGLGDNEALKEGINQYVIAVNDLRELFEKDKELRDNTIIVVSNKTTDGVTGIIKHADYFIAPNQSQLDATRWSIYQFSDAVFSSNEGDILYFAGRGADTKDVVIEKCSTLMPCFHGCDAHDISKIFKAHENRFCWIKADPTFEGLKQTLYEPFDRVKIQSLKPDTKNERYVISELKFINSGNLFGNQVIFLNENLNSIIGGKSSGKSLLLYATANSIDPAQVENASKRLGFEGYKFGAAFDFEVSWKNGDKDLYSDKVTLNKSHKIIYIPQLYINYLVEKNNKDELNTLIKNILLQDSIFKDFFDHSVGLIKSINSEIESRLSDYLSTRLKINEIQKQSKELGKSDSIKQGIQKIELSISEGQRLSNLTAEEISAYNQLILEQSRLENLIRDLINKETVLQNVLNEIEGSKTSLLGKLATESAFAIKGQIDRILDELTTIPPEILAIREGVLLDFNIVIANAKLKIDQLQLPVQKQDANRQLQAINNNLSPYLLKLSGQQELNILTEQLQKEKQRLEKAVNLEKQSTVLISDYENLRKQISALVAQRISKYKDIVSKINNTKNDIGSGITLQGNLIFKIEYFALYNQVNKAAVASNNYFNSLHENNLVKYDLIPELFSQFLRASDDKLLIDADRTVPLKQNIKLDDILRGLVADNFEIDYTVTYKGDDLLKMSPGKKGTVLLILFLQLSSSEYPILIDQPEDNLDNRTIYDLLCRMIKEKKKERQIIIVSHNANLVVATDSENVIVANQEGQGSPIQPGRFKFEYVNGAIEHSFPHNSSIPAILYQQGIKEHVCDILEGGDEAFKQRELKYNIK